MNSSPLPKQLIKAIPHARMIRPVLGLDRVKYVFWRLYTPCHPLFRDAAVALRLVRHQGRANYLLGKIAPGQSLEEFISFLVGQGFGKHFVAWRDEGELISLRYVEDFAYQYHLRLYTDGEVRGHYEFTPECAPFAHLRKRGMEDRRHQFQNFLGDRVVS